MQSLVLNLQNHIEFRNKKKSQIWPPKNKISPHLLTITFRIIFNHSYLIMYVGMNEVLVKWIVQKSNYHAHETVYIYIYVMLHAPHSDFNSRFTSIYPQSVMRRRNNINFGTSIFFFVFTLPSSIESIIADDVDFEHHWGEKEGDKEEWKYEMMWRDVK